MTFYRNIFVYNTWGVSGDEHSLNWLLKVDVSLWIRCAYYSRKIYFSLSKFNDKFFFCINILLILNMYLI
jgi:hypothetical protein